METKLTQDLENFKKHLNEEMRFKIEARDQEINEWKGKYQRLQKDKEALNDVLRHKMKEIEMMNRAVDHDGKKISK